MPADKFMDIIDKATKKSDAGHTIEATWRKVYTEISKFGNKIICEKSPEFQAFKGENLDDTYNNIVKSLLNIDMEALQKEIQDDLQNNPQPVLLPGMMMHKRKVDDSQDSMGDIREEVKGASLVSPMEDIADGNTAEESKLRVGLGRQATMGFLHKDRGKRKAFIHDFNNKRMKVEGEAKTAAPMPGEEKHRVLPSFAAVAATSDKK